VAAVISLKGIDQAIANLDYQNEKTLRYTLVRAIRGYYEDESSIGSIQDIDAEELVKVLWDTGDDPEIIRNKRKNLSSVKSSVNGDLKNLCRKGKNPEGITIGRSNIFVMSNEAKEKPLTSLSPDESITLEKISETLSVIKEVLSSPEALADAESSDGPVKLQELHSTIQRLAEKLGSGGEEAGLLVQPSEDEAVEEAGEGDALEGVEVMKSLDEGEDTGGADVEVGDGLQEVGVPVGGLGKEFPDSACEGDDGTRKNKRLAKAFDGYLGTMEKSYNQYLLIPQGEYIVGSKDPEKDEQPERRVRLAPFYMGKFPVTNALFGIFVEKTGYKTTAEKLGYATVYYGRLHKKVDEDTGLVRYTFNAAIRCETVYGACWYQPFGPDSTSYNKRHHPVVQVSLEDALAFAAWTGKRLPTENEWEAAARTEDGRVFPWGNEMKGNSCNIEESSVADTTVVNKYIEFENDLGIVDSIGNVLEWTLDTCEPPSHVKNTSPYRIVKGGSWISGNDVRLFSRFRCNGESPSNILGFRCVAS
jgi:formylglycine-generating enzyme required for sulfatase activity